MELINSFTSIFLICFISYLYGYYFLKTLKFETNKINIFESQIVGFFFLSFISLIINFFYPINTLVNNIIFLVSVLLFLNLIIKKKIKFKTVIPLILLTFLTLTIISFSNFQEDYPWYSIPYISLLNNEKISFGISNVQFRFGHISLLQYASATIPSSIINTKFISLPNLIIPTAFILWSLNLFFLQNRKNTHEVSFFFIFFISIFFITKFTRFSEYGNDVPAHTLAFLAIYYSINFEEKSQKEHGEIFTKILIFSTFAILQKIQYLFLILLPTFFIITNFYLLKKNLLIIIICFLFTVTWLSKNFINTSCLLFPSNITCFKNTAWSAKKTMDHSFPKKVYQASSAWSKGWPDQKNDKLNYVEYNDNYNWISTWSKNHGLLIVKKISPFLIISFFYLLFICLKCKKIHFVKYNFYRNFVKHKWLFIIIIFSLIIWFNVYPMFRYNTAFLISFFALIFSYIAQSIKIKNFTLPSLIILSAFFFLISKNLVRIYKDYAYNELMPKVYSNSNFQTYELLGGNKILKPEEGGCYYVTNICSHHGHLETIENQNYGGYKMYFYKK